MAETRVGLDIGEDAVRAVRVSAGLRGMEIVGCQVMPVSDGADVEGALSKLLEEEAWREGTLITAVSARDCSFHRVRIPFRDRKKIARVLPMEMEHFLPPGEGERLHDFMVIGETDTTDLLGVSVPRERVAERVTLLKAAGREAAIIDGGVLPLAVRLADIEKTGETTLYLHAHDSDWTAFLCREGRVIAVRSFFLAADAARSGNPPGEFPGAEREDGSGWEEALFRQIRNTCLSLLWREEIPTLPSRALLGGPGAKRPGLTDRLARVLEMPVAAVDLALLESIPMDDSVKARWDPPEMNLALALASRNFRKAAGVNFARDDFSPQKPHRELRKQGVRALILILSLLLLGGVDFYLDYSRDNRRLQALKNEVSLIFRETLPQVTRVVDPLQQMKVALDEAGKRSLIPGKGEGGESILVLLREISRLVGPDAFFIIKALSWDGETLEIRGETDRFNAVDQIKAALDPSPLFRTVTIASASLNRDNRVGFDLRVDLRR